MHRAEGTKLVQTPQLILKYYNAFLTDVGTNKNAF